VAKQVASGACGVTECVERGERRDRASLCGKEVRRRKEKEKKSWREIQRNILHRNNYIITNEKKEGTK